jgi:hypothetical protein
MNGIEFYIAVADKPSLTGVVYPAIELMKMADNKTLFWDDAHQALIYRGPIPVDVLGVRIEPRVQWPLGERPEELQ